MYIHCKLDGVPDRLCVFSTDEARNSCCPACLGPLSFHVGIQLYTKMRRRWNRILYMLSYVVYYTLVFSCVCSAVKDPHLISLVTKVEN